LALRPKVGQQGPSFHHSVPVVLLAPALPEQVLAAAGEVELAPPFYRTL